MKMYGKWSLGYRAFQLSSSGEPSWRSGRQGGSCSEILMQVQHRTRPHAWSTLDGNSSRRPRIRFHPIPGARLANATHSPCPRLGSNQMLEYRSAVRDLAIDLVYVPVHGIQTLIDPAVVKTVHHG